jgi:hypothetical protein
MQTDKRKRSVDSRAYHPRDAEGEVVDLPDSFGAEPSHLTMISMRLRGTKAQAVVHESELVELEG